MSFVLMALAQLRRVKTTKTKSKQKQKPQKPYVHHHCYQHQEQIKVIIITINNNKKNNKKNIINNNDNSSLTPKLALNDPPVDSFSFVYFLSYVRKKKSHLTRFCDKSFLLPEM